QHAELLRREVEPAALVERLHPRGVQPQPADLQHGRAGGGVPAQQGAHPGQQLGEGERFDQVVVCALVQAADPVVQPVAGGDHDDPHGVAVVGPPYGAAQVEAVAAGQVEVEQHQVVGVDLEFLLGLGRVEGDVDRVARAHQPYPQRIDQILFVLDHQQSHDRDKPRLCRFVTKLIPDDVFCDVRGTVDGDRESDADRATTAPGQD